MNKTNEEVKEVIFKYLKKKLSLFGIKKIYQFKNNFDLLINEIYDSLNYMDIALALDQKKINLDLSLNKNKFPQSLNDFYKIATNEDQTLSNISVSKKVNLKKILKSLNIKKNDNVLVHSSFMKLTNYQINEKNFFKELQNTIGRKGTIFAPGFNFMEYFSNKFNKTKTLPHNECGILSKFIFKLKNSVRSSNPIDSLIGIGKHGNICEKNNFCAYDDKSPWANLSNIKTKVIFVDVDFFYCSYLHRIEYKIKVPYRKIKIYNRKYGKYALYARKSKKLFLHYNKIFQEEELKRNINHFNFNDINFYSISCLTLDKFVYKLIFKNKNYFIKK